MKSWDPEGLFRIQPLVEENKSAPKEEENKDSPKEQDNKDPAIDPEEDPSTVFNLNQSRYLHRALDTLKIRKGKGAHEGLRMPPGMDPSEYDSFAEYMRRKGRSMGGE
jgi:hypothetical protein